MKFKWQLLICKQKHHLSWFIIMLFQRETTLVLTIGMKWVVFLW